MNNDINEIYRKKLIEKYGDPTPKVVDGKKFRVLNSNLNAYEKLINCLTETEKLLKIEISDLVLDEIGYFCLEAETYLIENITASIISLNKALANDPTHVKKSSLLFFNELEANYEQIMKNILHLINYFNSRFKTRTTPYRTGYCPNFQMNR